MVTTLRMYPSGVLLLFPLVMEVAAASFMASMQLVNRRVRLSLRVGDHRLEE